ncbi:MAG: AI-2E family transporter [Sediminibacterium sp.]|nr:AI-2E family transporter [Sediminibacterium sp.]
MSAQSPVSIRQISFYLLLIIVGVILVWELSAFIPAFLGALTFYILLSKPMNWLTQTKKWSAGLAATVLLLLTIITVLVPVSMAINIVYNKVGYAIQHSGNVKESLTTLINQAEQRFNITLISDQNIEKIGLLFAGILPKVVGATVDSLLTVVMMLFILFFLLSNNTAIEKWCLKHIPLQHENTRRIGKELNTLIFSNAVGIPATALFQGVIGAIGYYFLGVKDIGFFDGNYLYYFYDTHGWSCTGMGARCHLIFCRWRYYTRSDYADIWCCNNGSTR